MCIGGEHGGTWVEVCMSSCASVCVCWCACLFVTHTMQQDHTALLVCGISRFKIGSSVGGGQEQTAEREGRREGERGQHMMCMFTATKAEFCHFHLNSVLNLPTCQQAWGSLCGILKWEVLQYARWKVAKSVKPPLLTHKITVWRRESGTVTIQTYKEIKHVTPKPFLTMIM